MVEDAPSMLSEDGALLVPIRMVESLIYCPRQAWYRFTLGDDPVNLHMERGLRRHEQFADAATDCTVFRHLPVIAPQLGVQGVLDEVVVGAQETTIVEYKSTILVREVWPGVVTQVVVQALALQEHVASGRWSGPPLPETYRLRVYFVDSRRYRDVLFDLAAIGRGQEAIATARQILTRALPPTGNVGRRCANCQHEPVCLPFDLPLWIAASRLGKDEPQQ